MTVNDFDPDEYEEIEVSEEEDTERLDEGKRRFLLLLQIFLLVGIVGVGALFLRYFVSPAPLPQLIGTDNLAQTCAIPSYKFMIEGVNKPIGIAVSPDNQRIYVSESGEDKFIKMFDRDGNFITQFAPLGTDKLTRSYVYMATDPAGRLFAINRDSNSIDVFDKDGNYLDSIIRADMTISKLLSSAGISLENVVITRYDFVNNTIFYQVGDGPTEKHTFSLEAKEQFSPMGIRFDAEGNMLLTDVSPGLHSIAIIPAKDLADLSTFQPTIQRFGKQGEGKMDLYFPQSVAKTSKGEFIISDGNNARITKWAADQTSAITFGFGSGDGAVGLPRGSWMDKNDCYLVVDKLNSGVYVFDLSQSEPAYVAYFGESGISEGLFNYPTDITVDGTGRLYITDMNNNRVQIWSY